MLKNTSLFIATVVLILTLGKSGDAQQGVGPFTADQATAGRTAYQASCAGCHSPDLSGQGNASPLAGGLFMGSWGDKTAAELVEFLQGAMPPGNPGSLGEVKR